MPIPTVPFWSEVVTVPTGAPVRLFDLVTAAFTARGRTDVIDEMCATYQITAGKSNNGVVYLGDYTLAITPALAGAGAELAIGDGLFVPFSGGGMMTAHLGSVYVASGTANNYLLVRCYQAS